jgi:hypothetical protein
MRRKKEPCLNRFKLSEPNVEKVVNPPHSPIIKNKLKSDFIKFDFENHSKKTPIRKHPTILTIKVAIGNPSLVYGKIFPIKYLKELPRPPPINIKKNCFNVELKI